MNRTMWMDSNEQKFIRSGRDVMWCVLSTDASTLAVGVQIAVISCKTLHD